MGMEVAMDACVQRRADLIRGWQRDGLKPSYVDFVVKAVASALGACPRMNARVDGGQIVLLREVNIGVAVALQEGLVVPVIRAADAMTLKQIAQESSRLVRAARDERLVQMSWPAGRSR